ncbi:MarR family transcriptional regulator [Weissella paramesenteroides]|nr:MarR family transcriptional regulator [Weissella paramesenteroides]KAA8450492.1 MarR family transcriptional regulator [Weissella paramesenteroides]KAA8455423.1 MarR family transcriptional regulator [Weissella paramesenteroides]KAA8459475.1 MarR family transcriptional regulator [Weissella paramesenteroides]KAA8459572.1 MarR family transcriptional regulator [Weissella paramesenteroides]
MEDIMKKETIIKNILTIAHQPYVVFSTKIDTRNDKSIETLKILSTTENVTASYLSEKFDIKPSSVSQIVKKLEDSGMVTREKSGTDSRINYLKLTDKGRESLIESDATGQSLQDALFKDFTDDELTNFDSYLTRLIDNISNDDFKKQLHDVFSDDERWNHFDRMSARFERERSRMLDAEHARRHGHPHHFHGGFGDGQRPHF